MNQLLSRCVLCTPYNHGPCHCTSCKATYVECMHITTGPGGLLNQPLHQLHSDKCVKKFLIVAGLFFQVDSDECVKKVLIVAGAGFFSA